MFNKEKSFYVYIVSCNDNTLYTGYTNNIQRRLNQHNGIGSFIGAKYTRSRRPVFLSHLEKYSTKSDAMKREAEIKKMSHSEKETLIENTSKNKILSAI